MLMRSFAPMTRPLVLAPRAAANAELARPSDNPTPPAVFRKSLRSTELSGSDMETLPIGICIGFQCNSIEGLGARGRLVQYKMSLAKRFVSNTDRKSTR